ncbi:leucine-rich melanocyte differentiation-associated protein-like isoform X2 [Cylas formicarius]|nr:leucine-rich melanocyte differentiation-associated protein-like isoform X2 [Cylas formicarius]
MNILDMTSLRNLMLLERNVQSKRLDSDEPDDDMILHRLSLAYEKLKAIPKILVEELAPFVKILDISNNEFEKLDFLKDFRELTSLICDRNDITSNTILPYLPNLELLWLNHCKIELLYPWAKRLRNSCPNLKFLSLMGNPVSPAFWNCENIYEYLHYRLYLISLFPKLIHLDDKLVLKEERLEAEKMFQTHLMGKIVRKTQQNLPSYLRNMSERLSDLFTSKPSFAETQRNFVI